MDAQLVFDLSNQIINRVDTFKVVADSIDYLKAHFNFLTEEWQNQAVTALFTKGELSYGVLLDPNGDCVVPWEVLQQGGDVYVSCFCGELITTTKSRFFVTESGYIEEPENSQEPTPNIYSQLTNQFNDLRNYTEERLDILDGGTFTDW